MQLLLTSSGLTNTTLASALEDLLGGLAKDLPLAFIPTAANIEKGSKGWLIKDFITFQNAGFEVDIVDISAVSQEIWQPRLEAAKVLVFGGGNTFHLMHWLHKSGLATHLPELLKTRVYVGISAGSCVTGQTIYNSVQNLFDETYELVIKEGLGLVNFQTVPHLNSPYFPKIKEKNLREAATSITDTVYGIDDASAIVVNGDVVEVVSEGEWHTFN